MNLKNLLNNKEEKMNIFTFINYEDCLKRLNGNLEFLDKLLIKFYNKYRGIETEIEELLNSDQINEAQSVIHSIKGTSGNLGMDRLFNLSQSLEESIKIENKILISKELEEFKNCIHEIIIEIKKSSLGTSLN